MSRDLFINPHMTSSIRLASGMRKTAQNYPDAYEAFWDNIPAGYALGYNDFLKKEGGALSRANYAYLVASAREKNIPVGGAPMTVMKDILDTLQQIKALETGHEEELIDLAKDVVADIFKVNRDELNAKFMEEPGGAENPPQQEKGAPLTPELEKEVGKRSVMNGLAQGSGLHSLLSVHHHPIARDRVNEISNELLSLYDRFGNLISQSYYMMTPDQIEGMEAQLEEQGTGWSETDEQGNVQGSGMTFSIICQELVKGLVAKFSNHQFDDQSRQERGLPELSEEEKTAILFHADNLKYEPTQIQFGTELWRRFLSASTGEGVDKLDIVSYIGASPVEEVDDSMEQVTENPEAAVDLVSNMQESVNNGEFAYEGGPLKNDEEPEEERWQEDEEDAPALNELGVPLKDAPKAEIGGEVDEDEWASIMKELDAPAPKGIPQEEMGDAVDPEEWASLFAEPKGDAEKPKPKPKVDSPLGQVNAPGLPPVDIDDDDDDWKPSWMRD